MTSTTREVRTVLKTVTIVSIDTLHGCMTGPTDQNLLWVLLYREDKAAHDQIT